MAKRRAIEVLQECADLMEKKGAAYNGFPQAEYYPYGLRDIWYMCFTKVKRLESQIVREGEQNFESIEDTARDLINYSSFLIEYAEGKMDGQSTQGTPVREAGRVQETESNQPDPDDWD